VQSLRSLFCRKASLLYGGGNEAALLGLKSFKSCQTTYRGRAEELARIAPTLFPDQQLGLLAWQHEIQSHFFQWVNSVGVVSSTALVEARILLKKYERMELCSLIELAARKHACVILSCHEGMGAQWLEEKQGSNASRGGDSSDRPACSCVSR
jgi:hypothetical protein